MGYRALSLVALPLLVGAADRSTVQRKLSGPFVVPSGQVGGGVLTPDGSRVLYSADHAVIGQTQLYSVPIDGSAPPLLLSGAFTASIAPAPVRFTPDGTRALFEKQAADRELYSVLLDGSAPPTLLALDATNLLLTPDSSTLVFRADVGGVPRVLRVPIAGGASTLLDAPLAGEQLRELELDAGATGVVYLTRQVSTDSFRLRRAPLDGSAPPVTLGTWIGADLVTLFGVSATDRAVVQVRDGGVHQLASVPVDGSSAPVVLHSETAITSHQAALTPDGEWLVFRLGPHAAPPEDLYLWTVPTDGSDAAKTLVEDDVEFVIASDGTVLYKSAHLFGIAADGSAAAVPLSQPAGVAYVTSFLVTADASRAVFESHDGPGTPVEVFSVPLTGGTPIELTPPTALAAGGAYAYFADETAAYLWADPAGVHSFSIYRAPLDGSSSAVAIATGTSAPLGAAPGAGRLVFWLAGSPDLWSVRDDGAAPPLALNPPFGVDPTESDVTVDFAVSADGALAVYMADADVDGQLQLHAARIDRVEPAQRLTGDQPVDELYFSTKPLLTPDGALAIVIAEFAPDLNPQVFAVPTDGSSPPLLLSTSIALPSSPMLTPSGDSVVYVAGNELHVVPVDGSLASLDLGGAPGTINDPRITVSRVVWRSHPHLYSVPLDGSAPPLQLSATMVAGGRVTDFRVDPSGQRALYRADQEIDEKYELYSVPVDGSAAPVKLNQALLAAGDVASSFTIAPSGAFVVYGAFLTSKYDLFRVPIEGGAPVKLNGAVTGDTSDAGVSPDSSRVLFVAGRQLWSVPADGAVAPVRLNAFLPAGQEVEDYRISPSGARAIYVAPQTTAGVDELYSVPIAGGTAVRLNTPLVSGGDVRSASFSPDGAHVFYLADQAVDGLQELYRVRANGSGAVRRLNVPLAPGGFVTNFLPTQDGQHVVYRAATALPEVYELFVTRLTRGFVQDER